MSTKFIYKPTQNETYFEEEGEKGGSRPEEESISSALARGHRGAFKDLLVACIQLGFSLVGIPTSLSYTRCWLSADFKLRRFCKLKEDPSQVSKSRGWLFPTRYTRIKWEEFVCRRRNWFGLAAFTFFYTPNNAAI